MALWGFQGPPGGLGWSPGKRQHQVLCKPWGKTQKVHLSFSQKMCPACHPNGRVAKSSLVHPSGWELRKTGKCFFGVAFPAALGCQTL